MVDVSTLTEARKGDRRIMALMVKELAEASHVQARIELDEGDPKRLSVELDCARGLKVSVDFNGRCIHGQPNVFVLSWHMDHRVQDVKLAQGYWPCLNTCHFRKATDVVMTFEDLLRLLARRFAAINEGRAFQ